MRDYLGTTLQIERIPEARFLEDRWRWSVKIPAWMENWGLKSSGANPSGSAMTRRGAMKAALRAVRVQQGLDDREVTNYRLGASGERWVP